ncbi:hypothetical protein ACIRLA_46245 [Streptomyces sp. NPDC102364]|uniref:hypothetical protein n=1 Tax=Streptomyces sp. NPDC102364 TaxID=3366161 RepID=UPI00381003E2
MPHTPPPALEALLLNQMNSYTSWDQECALYFVYADHLSQLPWPQAALADHPRVRLHRTAAAFEDPFSRHVMGQVARPALLVGMAVMFEGWKASIQRGEERPTGSFAERDDVIEFRALVAHLKGHPPVTVMHERDSKHTGREVRRPVPTVLTNPIVPGHNVPSMLGALQRITDAVCAAPATFHA